MSAKNKPEAKAERREVREASARERGFAAAVQFAMQAARATGSVPVEVLEDSIAYGESLVKPGVSLEDALEVEAALKALRSLVLFRKNIEGAPVVFEVASAADEGGQARVSLTGPELAELRPGQRVVVTMMYDPAEQEQ